jgi:broad specificity phosphatase PhoE
MTDSSNIPLSNYLITLLRHGESVANAGGIHQGQADFELSEIGLAQARALAARWQRETVTFDRIISSPLLRARQTAEILAAAQHLPVEFDSNWMERDIGLLSGLSAEEAAQRFPRPAFMHPYQALGGDGESRWEAYLRAGRAVQDLLRRPPGSYLVVSHGAILNMVLYAMLGIIPQANFQGARFRFHNTSFAILQYDPGNHTWILERFNDLDHLDEYIRGVGE